MNDPIVSPWLVYLIMQVNIFNELIGITAVLSAIAVFGFGAGTLANRDIARSESNVKSARDDAETHLTWLAPALKRAMVVTMVFAPLAIFLPSQKTIIAVIAAKHITPQTVEQGVDVVKQVKDEFKADFIDVIKELTQDSTQVEKETQ